MSDWFYKQGDQEFGPVTRAELDFLASTGRIQTATLVRTGKNGEWQPFAPKQRRRQQPAGIAKNSISPSTESPATENNSDSTADPNSVSVKLRDDTDGLEDQSNDDDDHRTRNAVIGAVAVLLFALLLGLLFWDQLPSGAGIDSAGTGVAADSSGTDAGNSAQHSDQNVTADAVDDAASSQPAVQPSRPAAAAADSDTTAGSSGGTPAADAAVATSADANPAMEDKPESEVGDAAQNAVVAGDPQSRFTIEAPGEARFFGLSASGRRFSFVVDRSGSMQGVPLQRAKEELMTCIRSLPRHVEVQVVFFDTLAQEAPGGFRKLSRRGIDELQDWVDRVSTGGGTEVNVGMQKAFSGRQTPDAIFLLTDGGFDAGSPAFIQRLNASKQVQINTVALVSNAGAPLLKQIAKENRGDYRFVP